MDLMRQRQLKPEERAFISKGKVEIRKTTSLFESCLRSPKVRRDPKMTAHVHAEVSLLEDGVAFRKKWQRSGSLGPFSTLPQTPQHDKLSSSRRQSKENPEDSSEDFHSPQKEKIARPKFNVSTLRRWFQEIDMDKSGSITRRELIVALRHHKELQILLGATATSTAALADFKKYHQEAYCTIDAQNAELKRIIRILHQVDTDSSGSVEWDEFVELFRRGGFLVEYKTCDSLNDTSFETDIVLEAAKAQLKQLNLSKIPEGQIPSACLQGA
jgi:Ca2+-binding EF-hand superfamily protein